MGLDSTLGLRYTPSMEKICDGCGAIGLTCCESSRTRQETANTLARLVDRQSAAIRKLTIERDAARDIVRERTAR